MSVTTAEEFLMRPDEGCRSELVDGQIIERPFLEFWQGVIVSRLAMELHFEAKARSFGIVVSATGFKVATNPDTVLAPDAGFIAKANLPEDWTTIHSFFPGAPDLAVEVVSPGDTYAEVEDKTARYLGAGTRLVWIVRPKQKRVEVHRADGSSALLSQHETLSGESVVPGFELEVERIFG